MNKLDKQYKKLLKKILKKGVDKKDRTGTGTLSIFGETISHNMQDGFPLLTTKKMAVKTMMTELKWFLKGDTNIKYLVDNNCNIWNGDAYKAYVRTCEYDLDREYLSENEFIEKIKTNENFARVWGELGPIYGKQWRSLDRTYSSNLTYKIDQIKNIVNLLKTDPDSRRLLVNAWNPMELDEMLLPPCHYGFQVYTREGMDGKRYISLIWNQRSVDTFLGLPFNIASYGTLLYLLAEEVNMIPEKLIGNLGDVHLYKNHIEQAIEQRKRDSFALPDVVFENVDVLNGEFDYQVLGYKSHPSIKAPLSN